MKGMKTIFVFLVALFLLTMIPFHISEIANATIVKVEDWESYVVGSTSGSQGVVSFKRTSGDDFDVIDVSGNNWLKLSAGINQAYLREGSLLNDKGWVNFSQNMYGLKIDFLGRSSTQGSTANIFVNFSCYNSTGTLLCKFRIVPLTNANIVYLYYYDYTSGTTKVITEGSLLNDETIYQFRVNLIGGYGNQYNYSVYDIMNSFVLGKNGYGMLSSVPSDSSSLGIRSIYIDTAYYTSYGGTLRVGDIYGDVTTPLNITGNESYCGIDVSGYDIQIGNIYNVNQFYPVPSEEFSVTYDVPLYTTVRGLALTVGDDTYIGDSNPSNYILTVNGDTVGGALCFTPYQTSVGHSYILYWQFDYALTNITLNLIFNHTTLVGSGAYWYTGISEYDLDNDGDTLFYFTHKFTDCHWEWINIGIWLPFWVCDDYLTTSISYDVGYSFWCDYITPVVPNPEYNDSLGLHQWTTQNDTGYIYNMPVTNGIVLSYTLESQLDYYGIVCNYYNSSSTEDLYLFGEFPTWGLNFPSGTLSGIPPYYGTYVFTLFRGTDILNATENPIMSITAYVVGNWSNLTYYVYTNPPSTNQFEDYLVYYKNGNPTYDGFTTMFSMFDRIALGYNYKSYTQWVDVNNEGSFSYPSIGDSAEYWLLFLNKSYNYIPVTPIHTHTIKLPNIFENEIWVEYGNVVIKPNNPTNEAMIIYYTHTFPSTDISIYINNQYYQSVGDDQNGNIFYYPKLGGTYYASLVITQNNTPVTLDTCSFTVTVNTSGEPPTNETGILEAPYSYIAGVIVTMVCMILPVFVLGKIKIESDIIKYVPVFSGMLGFILSCLVGFFPWYAIFGLVLILVLVIVVMWQNNKA